MESEGAHRVRGLSITQLTFLSGVKLHSMGLEKKGKATHRLLRSFSVVVHFSLSVYYFSLYIPTQSFRQYRNLNVVTFFFFK